MKTMTIRIKFSLIGLPLLVTVCLLIFLGTLYFQKRQALSDLESKIQVMGDLAAYNLSLALPAKNPRDVQEVIQSLRQNVDLAYIILLDNSGNVISSYMKARAEQANYRSVDKDHLSQDKSIMKGKAVIHRQDQTLGELYLGLTLDSLRLARETMKRNLLLIILIIFLLGAAAIFVGGSFITTPLRRMTRTAREIADGDMSRRAVVSGSDEVGQLARSFNAMIDHVQASYRQMEATKQSLEKRVKERTKELQSEIGDRRKAEQALQDANMKLQQSVEQLEQRNAESKLLNELYDSLQTCTSEKEVFTVCAQFAKRLFPEFEGIFFVYRTSRKVLEPAVVWGESIADFDVMEPDECWALRQGKPHVVEKQNAGLICPHMENGDKLFQPYLCIPLVTPDEIIGLLNLRCTPSFVSAGLSLDEIGQHRNIEVTQLLALNFAARIAMTLVNLSLRERLRQQSIRDPLTGLFNRRFMEETLEREISRALRSGTPLGIIMMDIDYLKRFNDTYGHEAGDMMLRSLGSFLQQNVRKGDVACRFGGDEFVLIMPGALTNIAKDRAEHLVIDVQNIKLTFSNKGQGNISASFGVAVFPAHGNSSVTLIKAADEALLLAKKKGRSQVVVAGT
jgi:diguanylate cyclase (GGDEF)-like protein